MTMGRAWLGLSAVGMAAALLVACMPPPPHRVIYESSVYDVPGPPPEERVETIPALPSERMVWDPGHWKVEAGQWVWVPGHYIERPAPEAVWIPGHWIYHRWGSTWVPGHWT